MDIEIESRFQITVQLVDANGTVILPTSTMTAYWTWTFWDGTIDKITGVTDVVGKAFTFEVPDGFFTQDRIGEDTPNNIIVVDSSGVPVYKTLPAYDDIVQNSPTLEEIGV